MEEKSRREGRGRGERRDRRTEKSEDGEDSRSRKGPSKNPTRDQHKRHLDKLMENPDRPVSIPEGSKDRKPPEPPEFVRFYMGSSAGAGSEVFHVYRHLRRRENDRQDFISAKATEEELEDEFQETMAMHRAEDSARTAKKKAKRLKRKQRKKLARKTTETEGKGGGTEESKPTAAPEGSMEEDEEEETDAHFVIGGK